jgi:hypothetical protein
VALVRNDFLRRATRLHIPEDGILQKLFCSVENLEIEEDVLLKVYVEF